MKKKSIKFPKSDVRHWSKVVVQRRSRSDYSVRLQFDGQREWINTGKSEKTKAGHQAKRIYDYLRANGWEQTIRKYKKVRVQVSDDPTFGEFFEVLKEYSTLENTTLEFYFAKCRTLIGEIFSVPKAKSFQYAKSKDRQNWLKKIEAYRISEIKSQHLQKWKKSRIERAGTPEAKESAKRSLNTTLRSSKSLFSPRMQKALYGVFLSFPWSNAITNCDFEKVRTIKFRSCLTDKGGIQALTRAAERQLRPKIPDFDHKRLLESKEERQQAMDRHQQYKILLLALGAGLRRREIDWLRWQQLDFSNNLIRIETNDLTRTKSSESEGEVDVQQELMDILRQYKASAKGDFVVEGNRISRVSQGNYQYRCDRHFKALLKWLRDRGIDDSKPLHSLRKEFGAEMVRVAGIYEAASQLRHADIGTTNRYYAYKKNRATVDLFSSEAKEGEIRAV